MVPNSSQHHICRNTFRMSCLIRCILRHGLCNRASSSISPSRTHTRGLGMECVIIGEYCAKACIQPEILHRHTWANLISQCGNSPVFSVENDRTGCGLGHLCQQIRSIVYFSETVQLVTHHIEQQAELRTHLLHKMHGIRLIEFQNCNIGIQTAAHADFIEQRGYHASGEIGTGWIGEHFQSHITQHGGDHARGGGFAIGSRHQHHTIFQLPKSARQKSRIYFFDHLTGQGTATMLENTGCRTYRLAQNRRGKSMPWSILLAHITLPANNPEPYPGIAKSHPGMPERRFLWDHYGAWP